MGEEEVKLWYVEERKLTNCWIFQFPSINREIENQNKHSCWTGEKKRGEERRGGNPS